MKNAESVISNHLSSFQNNDLEAMMSDYTNESVLVTQNAVYKAFDLLQMTYSTPAATTN